MTVIKSTMFSPAEVKIAHELADALDDKKSLAFYLSCAKKYPHKYLRAMLAHVTGLPNYQIRTTRARLFTNIITNSVYNSNDRSWD